MIIIQIVIKKIIVKIYHSTVFLSNYESITNILNIQQFKLIVHIFNNYIVGSTLYYTSRRYHSNSCIGL